MQPGRVALGVSQWTAEPYLFRGPYDTNLLIGHYVITPMVISPDRNVPRPKNSV